ncbi:hypothetical protein YASMINEVIRUS_1446, partial [Yasminevirus sp. GU-2018]
LCKLFRFDVIERNLYNIVVDTTKHINIRINKMDNTSDNDSNSTDKTDRVLSRVNNNTNKSTMLDFPSDKPVTVVINSSDEKAFIRDCKKLYDLSKISNSVFCGVDFEFNMNWKLKTRYISAMQVIFVFDANVYDSTDSVKPVYVLNPLKIDKNRLKLFIKYILCSKVTKIFHGSDSLDYPHILSDLLNNHKRRFMKFLNSSVDTRFMCEITKRLSTRLNIKTEDDSRCSLYYALINSKVIDRKLFDILKKESDKINYNKPWIITKLTPEQIKYASYDVMYLYDLLRSLVKSVSIVKNTDGDVSKNNGFDLISVVNRLYRFHMINRLGLSKISEKCKVMFDSTKSARSLTKDDLYTLDQKIFELKLGEVEYYGKRIEIFFEDILSIDTTRKSIMNCLRLYKLDHTPDVERADELFAVSKTFNFMKGHQSITQLIDVVRRDNDKLENDIHCETNALIPHRQ